LELFLQYGIFCFTFYSSFKKLKIVNESATCLLLFLIRKNTQKGDCRWFLTGRNYCSILTSPNTQTPEMKFYKILKLIIIPPLAEWWVYWNTLVLPSVRPSLNLVYVTSHLSFVGFYSYLVSWLTMI